MPQKTTSRSGPIRSRSPRPAAAATASRLGGENDVAARLLVGLEPDEAFLFRFFEEVRERTEAIIGFVEARIAALEGLLHHGAPDLFLGAPLGDQRIERANDLVEGLLLLVFGGRCRLLAPFRRSPLLLVLSHEVVVVDELVAVRD